VPKNNTHQLIGSQVAAILRTERKKRRLSLSAVAERAGLSYQMVSYVEREMRSPTLDTLLRITGALQLSLSDIIQKAEAASKKTVKAG
jgi:transcriptional regulator with XRE-family HTH domain